MANVITSFRNVALKVQTRFSCLASLTYDVSSKSFTSVFRRKAMYDWLDDAEQDEQTVGHNAKSTRGKNDK